MKSFITLFMFAFAATSLFAESFPERKWLVKNDCVIIINGESNLNTFTCRADRYYTADNLALFYSQGEKYKFEDNRIVIDLRQFDCGKTLITRDFQQTLMIDEHPEIIISFLSLNKLPCDSYEEDFVECVVRITMAGVSKETTITFSVKPFQNGSMLFRGEHTFTFSDFELQPPTKFMGMIQVKNMLSVYFSLHLMELALNPNSSIESSIGEK